jgi:leader peptidase (prepilin peptidase) / N-methyltransferase
LSVGSGRLLAMELVLLAVAFVLGLVFGSFGNVVIHRVPAGESVIRPPSACPGCGAPIRPRDNIPILSWLLLRGRCRSCATPISVRYPLVELTSGLLFAAFTARFLLVDPPDPWALPGFLVLAWALLCVSLIDAATRRIPNRISYPLAPALLVLLGAAGLAGGEPGTALRALLGGVAGFSALLALALISPRGMGMGDVKLAGSLGIALGYLGWGHVLLGIFGGFFLGGVVAIVLLATKLRTRKDLLPFGPYLAISTLVTVLFGEVMIDAYLRVFALA